MSLMRRFLPLVLALAFMICGATSFAGSTKIIKVLQQRIDMEGRTSVSPSLYDRDAYQFWLRQKPEVCGGTRFQIQWKAEAASQRSLFLRIELVTAKSGVDKALVFERPVRAPSHWSRWSSITLASDEMTAVGEIIAWRVSLLDQETVLARQRSFLWPFPPSTVDDRP
jgi:hypothetical protein